MSTITSSARGSSVSGKVTPSALAALRYDQLDLRDSHPCALNTSRQLQLLAQIGADMARDAAHGRA